MTDYISTDKTNGTGNDTVDVTVEPTDFDRTTSITARTAGGVTKSVVISQAGHMKIFIVHGPVSDSDGEWNGSYEATVEQILPNGGTSVCTVSELFEYINSSDYRVTETLIYLHLQNEGTSAGQYRLPDRLTLDNLTHKAKVIIWNYARYQFMIIPSSTQINASIIAPPDDNFKIMATITPSGGTGEAILKNGIYITEEEFISNMNDYYIYGPYAAGGNFPNISVVITDVAYEMHKITSLVLLGNNSTGVAGVTLYFYHISYGKRYQIAISTSNILIQAIE